MLVEGLLRERKSSRSHASGEILTDSLMFKELRNFACCMHA